MKVSHCKLGCSNLDYTRCFRFSGLLSKMLAAVTVTVLFWRTICSGAIAAEFVKEREEQNQHKARETFMKILLNNVLFFKRRNLEIVLVFRFKQVISKTTYMQEVLEQLSKEKLACASKRSFLISPY